MERFAAFAAHELRNELTLQIVLADLALSDPDIPGGTLHLATCTTVDRAMLTIANSGRLIPLREVDRLFLPFHRLRSHPSATTDGVGLGLAIVQAIADAHDATLNATPIRDGGLRIDIGFPGGLAARSATRRVAIGASAWQRRVSQRKQRDAGA